MNLARPLKSAGNRQYIDEVTDGVETIYAKELDDDFNYLYWAFGVSMPQPPLPSDVGKVLGVIEGPLIAWVRPPGPGINGGAVVTVGATAPTAPDVGDMWWRNDPDGMLYIWYDDGSSQQWVPAVPINLKSMVHSLEARLQAVEARIG